MKIGDRVTIAYGGKVHRAKVTLVDREYFRYDREGPDGRVEGSLYLRDERKTWCLGWRKAAADVLKRAMAAAERAQRVEKRKRQRESDNFHVERIRDALRIVKATKLPPRLQPAALLAMLVSGAPYSRV